MTITRPEPVPGPAISRQTRLLRVSAVAASFLLAGFATVTTSRAAFTTTTSNTGNTASAASVALTDGDASTAMFTVSGLFPGQGATKCIDVTYTGNNLTNAIRMYRSAAVTGTGLDQYLDMTVEIGTGTGSTGGATSSCTGFSTTTSLYTGTMQSFMTTYQAWASGLNTTWTPSSSPQTKYFRISFSIQDTNAAQGKDVTFGFTWEAQL